jgi:hypothetical protein
MASDAEARILALIDAYEKDHGAHQPMVRMNCDRRATNRDRWAEYKRLRRAGFGVWESLEFASWVAYVVDETE